MGVANDRAHCALFHLRRLVPETGRARGIQFQPVPSMINSLLTRVFGSSNDRQLRQLNRIVARINALEPESRSSPTTS
jgi:Preprotein translocase subunit SecA (ATPase, RNA helicase)